MREIITQNQFEVLELLAQYKTSKEIAAALGISTYAVDQRIRGAVLKLNASSRREAASLFRAWEVQAETKSADSLSDYVINRGIRD